MTAARLLGTAPDGWTTVSVVTTREIARFESRADAEAFAAMVSRDWGTSPAPTHPADPGPEQASAAVVETAPPHQPPAGADDDRDSDTGQRVTRLGLGWSDEEDLTLLRVVGAASGRIDWLRIAAQINAAHGTNRTDRACYQRHAKLDRDTSRTFERP
jgi:hypothetical protein